MDIPLPLQIVGGLIATVLLLLALWPRHRRS